MIEKEFICSSFGTNVAPLQVTMAKVTDDIHDEMVRRYRDGESIHIIGRELGFAFQTVSKHLAKDGVLIRDRGEATRYGRSLNPESGKIYSCDNRFFWAIDTHEKAYWLGFLSADGCVYGNNMIQISLQQSDREHIVRFKSSIDSNHPIYDGTDKRGVSYSKLNFSNRMMSEDLLKSGIMPRKTDVLAWPSWLSDELLLSYTLGYYDGDGSVSTYLKRPQMGIRIVGNPSFIKDMQHYLVRKCGIGYTKLIPNSKSTRVINFACGGVSNAVKMWVELYKHSPVFLPRKLERVLWFFELHPHIACKYAVEIEILNAKLTQLSL